MSEVPPATSLDLEQLKREAEAQQRRRAPPLAGQNPKKRKLDGTEAADDEQEEEGPVSRFSYAADTEIAAGSTCFMASCGFNRQRSAAKEMLTILKPLLPEGTQIQTVKVGCRGLAVVRVSPAAAAAAVADSSPVPVTDIVAQVLDQIETGKLKHTKFCERIVPAETTCLLTSVALEAALKRVATAYLAKQQQQQQQQQQEEGGGEAGSDSAAEAAGQQQPVEFAVLYKSRGVDKQILAEMEKEALMQEQEQAIQQWDGQQSDQQANGASADADQQPQEQAAAGGDAGPVQGLDRQRVLDLAVSLMQECTKGVGGAKVNLSKPQVVVMVEAIPLLKQQMACAVTMIPRSIMSSSHKLKIKPTSAGESGKDADNKQKQKQAS